MSRYLFNHAAPFALLLGFQACSTDSDLDAGPLASDASLFDARVLDAGFTPSQNCSPLVGGDDDFSDGILATMWIPFNRSLISEENGLVSFALEAGEPPPQSAALFVGEDQLSLIGQRFFVEVLSVGNQQEPVVALMRFGNDNTDYRIEVVGNSLHFYHRSYGTVVVDETVVDYDPIAHRFWQMREEDGFVYAEVGTSANDWTLLGRSKVDIESEINALTDSYIGVGIQAREALTDSGLVEMDNFNTGSNCP